MSLPGHDSELEKMAEEQQQYQQQEKLSATSLSPPQLDELANSFSNEGYLVLRQVLLPHLDIPAWYSFSNQCFQNCFQILYERGHIDSPIHCADGAYTLPQGMKNGFSEIVMRSPGRYELSLLHMLDIQNSGHDKAGETNTSSSTTSLPPLPCPNPEKLLEPIQTLLLSRLTSSTSLKLVHFSLLVATPGSSDQSWHADGGHVRLDKHVTCHCFNVFIPLQDTPHCLGPTEIRPASHFLTRGNNLAKNMLVAKCRKTLKPPQWPSLQVGDLLMFDYRILHRGRANTTQQQNRNFLVLTFAEPWFDDMLNFPKSKSMYTRKEKT
jgi:hypothetical protein